MYILSGQYLLFIACDVVNVHGPYRSLEGGNLKLNVKLWGPAKCETRIGLYCKDILKIKVSLNLRQV